MKVELKEHTVEKQGPLGPVQKSLNQYLVFAEHSETQKMVQVGVLGTHEGAKFLPTIHDLDAETCAEIAEACGDKLKHEVVSAKAPKTAEQLQPVMQLDIDE